MQRPTLCASPSWTAPPLRLVILLLTAIAPVAGAQEGPANGSGAETNYLTMGAGAVVVRAAPHAEKAGSVLIDGSNQTLGVGTLRREPLPLMVVIELPASTTFTRFQTPIFSEFGSGKGRHIRTMRIEGSSTGPEVGFSLLVEARLAEGKKEPQVFPVAKPAAVRWVRVTLVDTHQPAVRDFDPHNLTELEGYGRQATVTPGEKGFTGRWRYRRKGINDEPGLNIVDLVQTGTQIDGCQRVGGQQQRITGSVVAGLARLVAEDDQGKRRPLTAVVTSDGQLSGVSFEGPAHSFYAAPDASAKAPCPPPKVANPVAESLGAGHTAVLYGIHFDVDSDVLRPDAKPALEQLLDALQSVKDLSVVVEGHTDSDGSDAHNLDLSARRAKAVVGWMTAHGVAATRLSALGKGEAEPIADNASSAGRALNRRVEIEPAKK